MVKGSKATEEVRKKISEAAKKRPKRYGQVFSKETREKISKTLKKRFLTEKHPFYGKKHTQETKDKIKEKVSGEKNVHLGKKHTEETKRKISESHRGEKSHCWKGGVSYQPYPDEWTNDLKDCIRKRDNFICQECGIHQDEIHNGRIKKLDVHHIDYNKENLSPNNLITLCRNCHIKTNHGDRKYWENYFKIVC